jgi:hypothetical protein
MQVHAISGTTSYGLAHRLVVLLRRYGVALVGKDRPIRAANANAKTALRCESSVRHP